MTDYCVEICTHCYCLHMTFVVTTKRTMNFIAKKKKKNTIPKEVKETYIQQTYSTEETKELPQLMMSCNVVEITNEIPGKIILITES